MLRQTSPGIHIAGYVLAGGASSRFGPDKALAYFAGQTLLQRAVGLLREIADSVQVIAPCDRYPDFGEMTIPDRWPGEGALGGNLPALHPPREVGYPRNLDRFTRLARMWLSVESDCKLRHAVFDARLVGLHAGTRFFRRCGCAVPVFAYWR